jgi:hypothetical protein
MQPQREIQTCTDLPQAATQIGETQKPLGEYSRRLISRTAISSFRMVIRSNRVAWRSRR